MRDTSMGLVMLGVLALGTTALPAASLPAAAAQAGSGAQTRPAAPNRSASRIRFTAGPALPVVSARSVTEPGLPAEDGNPRQRDGDEGPVRVEAPAGETVDEPPAEGGTAEAESTEQVAPAAPAVPEGQVRWVSPGRDGVLFAPGTAPLAWMGNFPEGAFYTVTLSRDGHRFDTVVAGWRAQTRATWPVPSGKDVTFFLRVKAMDAGGKLLDADTIPVHVLPQNAIVISKANQALWAFQGGKLRGRFSVSTGKKDTETREGWFAVYNRVPDHYSKLYDAPMPFTLFFSGGMAIHASTFIKQLGTPASHGCVRMRYDDARELYTASPVGRPVLVTGWGQDMAFLDALVRKDGTRTARNTAGNPASNPEGVGAR